MPKKYTALLLTLTVIFSSGCVHLSQQNKSIIYQYSTSSAFLAGAYDGGLSVGQLKEHGNFGLGAFNGIDGELILVGGVCYQAKSDGKISRASNKLKVPFAVADFFRSSTEAVHYNSLTYKQLLEYLDLLIPDKNSIFAIKVEGDFVAVKTRSFVKQDKPYKPFSEVAKSQSVAEFSGVKGVLVGFYFPGYMKELNFSGYHFHFISRDKKSGGHLLDCSLSQGIIRIQKMNNFFMALPDNQEAVS
ncbi:MAG: acetolactate decarboxylase [Candidatus Omnitrophota bacterium]|jgi:acetolactate decarboxylase